jgi:hypothetical protein
MRTHTLPTTLVANDKNKRTILRLASLLGLGVIASQLLPKKAEASGTMSGVVRVKNSANSIINPVVESGNLATIATNIPAQGQAMMDASMPIALASNQTILSTNVADGAGNTITSTANALDVNIRSGTQEISYTENSFTNSAQGRLMMGRYGTEINALQTDAQGNLKIDDPGTDIVSINGEPIPTTAPGVLPTTLVDMGGQPLETFSGNLQVGVSNPKDFKPLVTDVVVNGSGQGVNQFVIKPTDVRNYAIGYLQVGGVFTATYNFEGSNSILASAWVALTVKNVTLGTMVTSNTVAGQYEIAFRHKYFRVRISAFTSGLAVAQLRLSPLSIATNTRVIGHALAGSDGVTANVTAPNIRLSTRTVAPLAVMAHYRDVNTTYDVANEIVNNKNDANAGNKAVGMLAQLSEVPIVRSSATRFQPVGTLITEKQFGNLRMSKDRSLNVDITSADSSGLEVSLTPLSEIKVQSTPQVDMLAQILDASTALYNDLLAVQPLAQPLLDKYSRYVGVLGTTAKNIQTVNVMLSASTSETPIISGLPGKYAHIRSITLANTDAVNSSSVVLRDTVSGVVVHQWQVPANSTQSIDGGKGIFLPQTNEGNTWTAQCGTPTTSMFISATYEVA